MANIQIHDPELYAGLTALAESAFPKRCNTCGRSYASAESFIRETQGLTGKTGLKASADDDGLPIVELFRNCICGSTLLDIFNDRRDTSQDGKNRRAHFGKMLTYLERRGIPRRDARLELLRILRGENSDLLAALPPETSSHQK